MVPSINEHSVCDCYRLGKYSSERSWPLLVKPARLCDVYAILSQRSFFEKAPFNSKPCMPPAERHIESILGHINLIIRFSSSWLSVLSVASGNLFVVTGHDNVSA